MNTPEFCGMSAAVLASIARNIKAGCTNAFEKFYRATIGWAINFVRAMLRGRGAHMSNKEGDVAHVAYLSLWKARRRLDPSRSLRSYFTAILVNAAKTLARKRRKECGRVPPSEDLPSGSRPVGDEWELTELVGWLRSRLSARENVLADNLSGSLSNEAARDRLGVSESQFHIWKNALRAKCRRILLGPDESRPSFVF